MISTPISEHKFQQIVHLHPLEILVFFQLHLLAIEVMFDSFQGLEEQLYISAHLACVEQLFSAIRNSCEHRYVYESCDLLDFPHS